MEGNRERRRERERVRWPLATAVIHHLDQQSGAKDTHTAGLFHTQYDCGSAHTFGPTDVQMVEKDGERVSDLTGRRERERNIVIVCVFVCQG